MPGKIKLFPARESSVSENPARDRIIINLFYSVVSDDVMKLNLLELSGRVCGLSGFNIRKIFPPASFQSTGVETLMGLKVIRNRGESIGRKGERDGEERKGEGKE
jgi:hypothetical protein